MSPRRPWRAAVLAAAALAVLVAGPAAAHPPTQHDAQLRLAGTAQSFNLKTLTLASASAKCEDGQAGPYPCKGVDLESFVPLAALGGASGNDIWGWRDPKTKREYAIVGTSTSTGFVDVTDAKNPKLLGVLPTRGTPDYVLWRDVKVAGNHAFIVSEISDSGLQVFDLTRLRDAGPAPQVFKEDAAYDGFSRAHNISINTETDTAYVVGTGDRIGVRQADKNECRNDAVEGGASDTEAGGVHMVDISEPLEPRFLGCALVQDADGDRATESNNYVHDIECVVYDGPDKDYTGREICLGSNEDEVVVYDVTDKSAPRVISSTSYDGVAYTHQGALTEDRKYFLFGDEIDEQQNGHGTMTYILDVRDLDSLPFPKAFEHETKSIDHNMYVHGDRVYQSNYTAGLRILEFDKKSLAAGQLEEVAFFDVVPGVDIAEYAGTWSNFRFPSGTTVVSAIENEVSGLFVLKPQRAGKRPPRERKRPDRGAHAHGGDHRH